MEASWKELLLPQFSQPYMQQLRQFLLERKSSATPVYPPNDLWFAAFDNTPFDQVRVVILGQDPYHGLGQAHGLCFSVTEGVALPPSLQNIFTEIQTDLLGDAAGKLKPTKGDLTYWAKQGVLLLNAVLTVEQGKPASHQGQGWEQFTDQVVELLANRKKNLIFMLWGNYAQRKGSCIDRLSHLVLTAPHPSPFSVHKGFFGCRHFSKCNQYLSEHGQAEINWLPEA